MAKPPPPPPSNHKPAPLPPPQTYQQVLRYCGYPDRVVVLDFETFFSAEYGLKKLSIPEYINDKRWEVLGLAVKVDDLPATFIVGEEEVEEYLRAVYLENVTVLMQNSSFDAMVLAMKYGIHPPHLIDTVNLARAFHARSRHGLADLAKKFSLPDKGKTSDFLNCTRRTRYQTNKKGPPTRLPLMTEAQEEAMAEYAKHDAELTWEVFKILLPRLARPELELRVQKLTLEMVTKPELMLDSALGKDLIQRFSARMAAEVEALGVTQEEVSGNKTFDALLTTALEQAEDRPQMYMKAMKRGWSYELAKDDPGLQRLLNHNDVRVSSLVKARQTLKSLPLHIRRVENIAAMAAACGGLLPVPLNYAGAATMRDSGGWRINLQNLGRTGDQAELRGLLIAPPGKSLVVVDMAAIEARVNPYLAGEQKLIDAFREGRDVYCEFGSIFYGVRVRKPRKDDPPPVAALMKARRQFAKICCLGLGYSMSANRFADFAKCDAATAERAVTLYRNTYPSIVRFWADMGRAFLYTAKYHKPVALPRGIEFYSEPDCDVVMRLPSGHVMRYHRVRIEKDQFDRDSFSVFNDTTETFDHLYGAMLVENAVQSTSRHLLMEALVRLDDMGYRTVHRVHDEIVICVDNDKAQGALDAAIGELSRSPAWAPGLPLSAEGCVAERYSTH